MNKNKKRAIVVLVLLLLLGVSGVYVSNTYAKYKATLSNMTGSVPVAKWAFASDNTSTAITINLAAGVQTTSLVSGKIAPGTSGSFNIQLANTNSDVGVEYTMLFTGNQNVPKNLVFKLHGTNTTIDPTTQKVTGTIAVGGSDTVAIDWEWPYYTSDSDDDEDKTDGEAANNMTITASITGVQTDPTVAVTTTHTVSAQ